MILTVLWLPASIEAFLSNKTFGNKHFKSQFCFGWKFTQLYIRIGKRFGCVSQKIGSVHAFIFASSRMSWPQIY